MLNQSINQSHPP